MPSILAWVHVSFNDINLDLFHGSSGSESGYSPSLSPAADFFLLFCALTAVVVSMTLEI